MKCMNFHEGTKRIHFQSTTEMKINSWHRAAGKSGGKISSSTLPHPNIPCLFSSLHSSRNYSLP